ncbi:hypothetical protein CLV51_103635 [Chitinophaga niastensis]|uniref:Uncharacterized protein n=1 Tax=Chitinophaga niastensis TaxID=536980 RepID=A0A2P8HKB3_CHINA|nr:hypothetical protein [Chitinophaga niastensis]PSL46654.1 hypothetical protein CLV51_103635 [Chitinophaga niastensis]
MDDQTNLIDSYFSAPKDYIWSWGDDGEVLECSDFTICYTDELINILGEMALQGWPPLGSILLVLCACKDARKYVERVIEVMNLYSTAIKSDARSKEITLQIHKTHRLLEIITQLPKKYRSANNRALLLKTIFEPITPYIESGQASQTLHFFYKSVFTRAHSPVEQLSAELTYLANAATHVKDSASLELKLRTSLEKLPEVLPVSLPEESETDFFTRLSDDGRTAGISRLAKRLQAALHVPMHTYSSSELAFGGISDITNKGNYDRLLLSELAQDDQLLMARLANNEALYLRREDLPADRKKNKVILVDTTLKMWGIPRVFAVSAALACIHQKKEDTNVQAYSLKGVSTTAIDLYSKDGVINALSILDNYLHAAKGLENFMQQEKSDSTEYFLITNEQLMLQADFRQTVANLKPKLTYLITVNRNGQFHFYDYNGSSKKLLASALLNLEEILFAPVKTASKKNIPISLPAIFLRLRPMPLRYPASRLKRLENNSFDTEQIGVVNITTDLRVLYWPEKDKAAIELHESIEEGNYYFGINGHQHIYILVNPKQPSTTIIIYAFNVPNRSYIRYNTNTPSGDYRIVYQDGIFTIRKGEQQYAYDALTGKTAIAMDAVTHFKHTTKRGQLAKYKMRDVFKFLNNGYSTISRIQSIYVSDTGELIIENRQLFLVNEQDLILTDKGNYLPNKTIPVNDIPEEIQLSTNANIKLSRFTWADGSEAIADPRGFLHLRSSDKTLPEITITMVLGITLAAWSSAGTYCGNSYFTEDGLALGLRAKEFYANYIQRFIAGLK